MVNIWFNTIVLLILLYASIYDIKHRIVLDRVHLALIITGFAFGKFHLIDTVAVFALMFFVYKLGEWIFKKDALGFGDVKLFTAIGFLFGFFNFLNIFFYAFLIAGIYGVFILLFKKSKDHTLPFVPFIGLAVLWSELIF